MLPDQKPLWLDSPYAYKKKEKKKCAHIVLPGSTVIVVVRMCATSSLWCDRC